MQNAEQKQNSYRIPAGTKLIIVDAHDTIFKPDLSRDETELFNDPKKKDRITWMLRYGFLNFVEYFAGQKKIAIVISSDGQKNRLTEIAQRFGIFDHLTAIYGAEHIDKWDYLKQLDKILDECQVKAEHAVFIGDSQVDQFSAEKYGIPFIQVPNTLSERAFSFNRFLEVDFNRGGYGLELINFNRIKKVFHNLSTPQLVEASIRKRECVLAHLGPLVINAKKLQPASHTKIYIVKEPSSEEEIRWCDDIRPYEMHRYRALIGEVKSYLEDKSVYIQDCFAGSEASCRIPLRMITQNAWHSLFVRHMFRQATEAEMASFFPEYTLIHIPSFKARAKQLEGIPDNMILINLLKKKILVLGTHSSNVIRKAVFLTLSFILPKNDMIPVRCNANKRDNGELSLFFGEDQAFKNRLCLNSEHAFFGDDCHGWTQDGFTNIEWGCRTHVDGLNKAQDPKVFSAAQQFSTILENVKVDDRGHLQFKRQNPNYRSVASFPITHLKQTDRSGIAAFPKHMFILVKDALGVLPAFSHLTQEQAALFLLLGYGSERPNPAENAIPDIYYHPFYNSDPLVYGESFYTSLLYEKLVRSEVQCWLINVKPLGSHKSKFALADPRLLQQFVALIQSDASGHFKWHEDPNWGINALERMDDEAEHLLNPAKAWESEPELFLASIKQLKHSFQERLEVYRNSLPETLQGAVAEICIVKSRG